MKDTERDTEVWGWCGVFPEGMAMVSSPMYTMPIRWCSWGRGGKGGTMLPQHSSESRATHFAVSRPCERTSLATSPTACSFPPSFSYSYS